MADGSCSVWLEPHLLNARVELWFQSYDYDYRLTTFIPPGWQHPENPSLDPYKVPGDPFTAYDTYAIKFPEQTINGVTYKAIEKGYAFVGMQDDWEYTLTLEELEIVEGRIIVVYYWIEGMPGWQGLEAYPTPAKVGDEIHVYVVGDSETPYSVLGHIDINFTSPSRYTYVPDAVSGQDKQLDPDAGFSVQFAPVNLNESGSWEFYGQLKLDGTIVDFKKFSFTVEAPPPDIKITSLNYPSGARAGEEIEITWYWKNEGGNGSVPQWARIRDLDTGGLVSPGEYGFALYPGGVAGVTIYPTMPNRDWRLKAETGYETTITDTRTFTITLEAPEPENVVIYVWDETNGSYLGGDWGKATLDGVAKDPSGGTAIFYNIEVGRHTVSVDVPGYDFDSWDSGSGDSWIEILIDSPNSPSTWITTQSGGHGFLRAYVTETPPELQDVIVYAYDLTNKSYLSGWGTVTLDGVTKSTTGSVVQFLDIEVGRHTVSIQIPGYDFDHWDSWGGLLVDNPNSSSTGITTQSGETGFLRAYLTKSLPSSAIVTVKGRATGGYPTPTMRLYVYDKGAQVGYKDFSPISIGSWYTYEKIVTGAGSHSVYGRMRLRNALGSFYKNTETVEFELG